MNNIDYKYENTEICKQCGGYCCKKSGCDYFVSDLESMKLEYLESLLNTGRVSVVASFGFERLKSGKLTYKIMLSLRARNKNREAIDLLSFKTTCASLTETGCYYDVNHRPSGGATLIPCNDMLCYSKVDRMAELYKWQSYQTVLAKLVKRITKMSVTTKLKQDVENLLYNILTENFQDVLPEELQDIACMTPLLIECFPEEYQKAMAKYKKITKPIMLIREK